MIEKERDRGRKEEKKKAGAGKDVRVEKLRHAMTNLSLNLVPL